MVGRHLTSHRGLGRLAVAATAAGLAAGLGGMAAAQPPDGEWIGRGCRSELRLKVEGGAYEITIHETTFKGRIADGRRIDLNMPGAAQRHFRGEFVGDTFKAWVFNAPAAGSGPSITPCRETFDLVRAGAPASVAKAEPPAAQKPDPAPPPATAKADPPPSAKVQPPALAKAETAPPPSAPAPTHAEPPKADPAKVPPPASPAAKAPEPAAPAPPAAPPPAPAPANAGDAVELAFWETIKNSSNPADFKAYLESFPNGRFAPLARLRAQPPASAPQVAAAPAPAKRAPLADLDLGAYHALVIGNDAYRHLPKLKTAVRDAQVVAQLLRDAYGFQTRVLTNATRHDMLAAMTAMRQTLTERDNLLIFYAGHGILDTDTERGYWLPVDAEKDIPANWVSNADLTDVVKAIRARHVLVVADSCYSGTLVRSVMPDFRNPAEQETWWRRVAGKRSRAALTSGGLEPVLDGGGAGHSVFARAFLQALQENDGILDASGLFKRIQRPVVVNSDQTPAYSDIRGAGHDGGEFLFVRRR
jgi:hypothetical protein